MNNEPQAYSEQAPGALLSICKLLQALSLEHSKTTLSILVQNIPHAAQGWDSCRNQTSTAKFL